MARDSWQNLLAGAAVTLMTGAVAAVFTKVYDTSEKMATLETKVEIQEKRIDSLDALLDIERIQNARTRATCDKWAKELQRRFAPE